MDYKHDLNSDDDFDCSNGYNDNYGNGNSNGRMSNPNGLSKAELRKTNKPIMEKRRRARINHCLNELKSLILEAMKKDPARHTKLEKADILEMTVKHLQSVQRQQLNMAIQTDPSVIHKFKTGFVECAEEVNRYVAQLDGIDVNVRQRLTNHLNNCANSLEQIGSMTNFNNGYRGQLNAAASAATLFQNFNAVPQDLNNNSNSAVGGLGVAPTAAPIQMGGLQLIPSRLPSGEFALIMPNAGSGNATGNPLMPPAPFAWPGAAASIGNPTPSSVTAAALQTQPPTSNLAMANPNHLNDYAQTFRMSAFSKPHQTTTTTPPTKLTNYHAAATGVAAVHHTHNSTASSPPLSPISSVSSRDGDDSLIMQTQADFVHAEPNPANNSFAGVFSTPPPTSAETSFNSSSLNSSTSSTHSIGSIAATIGNTNVPTTRSTTINLQQQQVTSTSGHDAQQHNTSLKRERSDAGELSDCSLDEPVAKKAMSVTSDKSASAWRPW